MTEDVAQRRRPQPLTHPRGMSIVARRLLKRALVAAISLLTAAATGVAIGSHEAAAAPSFRVLAFYNGTWDAAHIDFDKEARDWFPQAGAQYGFSWEATTDWSRLSATGLAGYKVIMFLDDMPPAGQRAAFQQYMQNGGAWFGFHVSAFTTDANSWSWYHNTFLGAGNFVSNTWGPTAETLRIEDRNHPSTAGLPATIQSSVSEWYSWSRDLRQNPDIDVLASIDASSFPVGTDPNQQWTSGYYPLLWTNKNYKMLYANFGHNGMNYETNTRTSSTFASAQQNQWLINGLLWLGGQGTPTTPPTTPPSTPADLAPDRQQGQREVRGRPGRRHHQRHRHPAVRLQRLDRPAVPARDHHRRVRADQQPRQQQPGPRRDERVHRGQRADPDLVLQRREQPAVAAGRPRAAATTTSSTATAASASTCPGPAPRTASSWSSTPATAPARRASGSSSSGPAGGGPVRPRGAQRHARGVPSGRSRPVSSADGIRSSATAAACSAWMRR